MATSHFSWRAATRVVLPLWGVFTLLRWALIVGIIHVLPPSSEAVVSPHPLELVDKWDADFFLDIAADGYQLEQYPFRAAFFPGFPLSVRLLAGPLTWSMDQHDALRVAALLITTLCSLAASLMLYRVAHDQFGPQAASWAVLLLMCWPSAAFLTAFYSEAPYLILALGAWHLATRQHWVLAGAVCGVASFFRVNGAFLCAAILVMYVLNVRRRREPFKLANLAGVLLGLSGLLVFFAFLYIGTTDLIAWSHVQEAGWGRHLVTPWESFTNTWTMMTGTTRNAADRWQMLADIVILAICAGLTVVMATRRYWPELTLTALSLTTLVTSTFLYSVSRSTLTVFPLMLVGGSVLARRRPPTALVAVVLSGLWMSATMSVFALQYWAG